MIETKFALIAIVGARTAAEGQQSKQAPHLLRYRWTLEISMAPVCEFRQSGALATCRAIPKKDRRRSPTLTFRKQKLTIESKGEKLKRD
jgi:hypothetical protein